MFSNADEVAAYLSNKLKVEIRVRKHQPLIAECQGGKL